MLKMTRKFGLGVLLVAAPLLVAIYSIATGNFIFDDQGRGITLLIVLGLGSFGVMTWIEAAKIDVIKNAESIKKERGEKARCDVKTAQHGYSHS